MLGKDPVYISQYSDDVNKQFILLHIMSQCPQHHLLINQSSFVSEFSVLSLVYIKF